MALSVGSKLGPYEIISPLGVGGMGEVYRARDSKLGRDVALKIISPEFAHDDQRMARFQREAQVLASLNHAHISAIYGFEDSGAVRALVMELVEGATLAERILQGPIPLDEALPIARQIAEALECAHERGIIHRDLKPANIKLTPDGKVKVLDFGLAKALQDDSSSSNISNSPTLTIASTKAGMILGTAAYMSPEQAKGKTADRRADIWSFGVLFFEMLTAKQAFGGETVSDSLAAIIKDAPDWTQLPSATPARIRELLGRCLQKDPKQRLQAIGDARIAIDEALSGSATDVSSRASAPSSRPAAPSRLRILPWALAAALAVALIATVVWQRLSPSASQRPVVLSFALPPGQLLDTANGSGFVVSPDGSRIAYVTLLPGTLAGHLYVRDLDQSAPVLLDGAGVAASPFFSPDSQWIGFFGDGKLQKISVRGGAPIVLCSVAGFRGADWSRDSIIFPANFTSALSRVSAAGGDPVPITHLAPSRGEITQRWPQILPDGKAVIFTASSDNNFFAHASVEAASLDTGAPRLLVENAYFGRYLPGGFLAYVSQGTVFVAPFDARTLKVTGTAISVLQGVVSDISNGGAQFSVSRSGTVAYLTGASQNQDLDITMFNRQGDATVLIKDQPDAASPRFSPDGKRIAFQKGVGGIWIYDLARGMVTPVTLDSFSASYPVWTPDGQRLTYSHPHSSSHGAGQGIYWKRADGSGNEEPLTPDDVLNAYPTSWSPDGKTLAFERLSPNTGSCCELWTLTLDANGKPEQPRQFLADQSLEQLNRNGVSVDMPDFSPDGRWLAYSAELTGTPQIYVVPFPGPGGKWQISTQLGIDPRWSKAGHELFFLDDHQLYAAPYSVENGVFQSGKPQLLFSERFEMRQPFPSYDVSPDGQHFVSFQSAGAEKSVATEPTVVLNWVNGIRQMVATAQADSAK